MYLFLQACSYIDIFNIYMSVDDNPTSMLRMITSTPIIGFATNRFLHASSAPDAINNAALQSPEEDSTRTSQSPPRVMPLFLWNVVLLLKQISSNLRLLQQLEITVYHVQESATMYSLSLTNIHRLIKLSRRLPQNLNSLTS